MKKRILSFLLAAIMLLSSVPMITFAASAEESGTTPASSYDYDKLYVGADDDSLYFSLDFFSAKETDEFDSTSYADTYKDFITKSENDAATISGGTLSKGNAWKVPLGSAKYPMYFTNSDGFTGANAFDTSLLIYENDAAATGVENAIIYDKDNAKFHTTELEDMNFGYDFSKYDYYLLEDGLFLFVVNKTTTTERYICGFTAEAACRESGYKTTISKFHDGFLEVGQSSYLETNISKLVHAKENNESGDFTIELVASTSFIPNVIKDRTGHLLNENIFTLYIYNRINNSNYGLYIKPYAGGVNTFQGVYSKKPQDALDANTFTFMCDVTSEYTDANSTFTGTADFDVVVNNLLVTKPESTKWSTILNDSFYDENETRMHTYSGVEVEKSLDSNMFIGVSSSCANHSVYALRIYTRTLSQAEIAQNHFADLAKFFSLEMYDYDSLAGDKKANIHKALASLLLTETTDEETKAAVQAAYDAAYIENSKTGDDRYDAFMAKVITDKIDISELIILSKEKQNTIIQNLGGAVTQESLDLAVESANDTATPAERYAAFLLSARTQGLDTDKFEGLSKPKREYIGVTLGKKVTQNTLDEMVAQAMATTMSKQNYADLYVSDGLRYHLSFFNAKDTSEDNTGTVISYQNGSTTEYGTVNAFAPYVLYKADGETFELKAYNASEAKAPLLMDGYLRLYRTKADNTQGVVYSSSTAEIFQTPENLTFQTVLSSDVVASSSTTQMIKLWIPFSSSIMRNSSVFSSDVFRFGYQAWKTGEYQMNWNLYSPAVDSFKSYSHTISNFSAKDPYTYTHIYDFNHKYTSFEYNPALYNEVLKSDGTEKLIDEAKQNDDAYWNSKGITNLPDLTDFGIDGVNTKRSKPTHFEGATIANHKRLSTETYLNLDLVATLAEQPYVTTSGRQYKVGNDSGINMNLYAMRVYNKALSEAELQQNHFADLVTFKQVDVSTLDALTDAQKAELYSRFAKVTFANKTAEELSAKYEEEWSDIFFGDMVKDGDDSHNHVIELAKFYSLDLTEYNELPASVKALLFVKTNEVETSDEILCTEMQEKLNTWIDECVATAWGDHKDITPVDPDSLKTGENANQDSFADLAKSFDITLDVFSLLSDEQKASVYEAMASFDADSDASEVKAAYKAKITELYYASTSDDKTEKAFYAVADYYSLDLTAYNTLAGISKSSVQKDLCSMVRSEKVDRKVAVLRLLDAVALQSDENFTSYYGQKLITFDGYSVRKSSYAGLRSVYLIDKEILSAFVERGYTVSFGAIMAIADGNTASSLTISENADGSYKSDAKSSALVEVYKDNAFNPDAKHVDLTDELYSMAFTTTFKNEASQKKENYEAALLYRAYVVLEKDGEKTVFYTNNESSFDEVSVYNVSKAIKDNYSLAYSMIQKVLNAVEGTDYSSAFIAGNELFDYSIVHEDDDMLFVSALAKELNEIIEAKTGTALPVIAASKQSPDSLAIKFFESNELGNDNFGVYVEDGNLCVVYDCAANAKHAMDILLPLFDCEGDASIASNFRNMGNVPTYKIVAVGASNTASGEYALLLDTYLQTQYGDASFEVINAGRSGGTIESALRTYACEPLSRIDREVFAEDPDAVVIQFFLNAISNSGIKTNNKNRPMEVIWDKTANAEFPVANLYDNGEMLSVAEMKENYPGIFTSEGRLNLQVKTFTTDESFEAAMADAEKTSDVNYAIDSTFIRDENGNLKFDAEVKKNNITECGKQFYDMYNLVEECLSRGIKVILPTPVDYDEEWDGYTGERILGLKYICADTSEFIKTVLAEKEGVDFVDFYAVQLELKKQLQTEDSTKSYTYDRKHFTGMVAPYAIASTFMVDMYGKNLIHGESDTKVTDYAAKTEILADGSIITSNASVSELSVGESKVSFLYKPHGISIGYVSDFQKAKAILGDDEVYIEDIAKYAQNMNQEIIKVAGLADGSYKIKMGTYTLTGTYTAEELAEGVDISCDANNPSRLVADLIIKEINAKKSLFAKLTNMAYARQSYLLPYGVNDRTDSREVVENRINEAHASAVASGSSFGVSATAKFMENYDALDNIYSEIDLHSYNAKKLMDFDAYQVVIEKAN